MAFYFSSGGEAGRPTTASNAPSERGRTREAMGSCISQALHAKRHCAPLLKLDNALVRIRPLVLRFAWLALLLPLFGAAPSFAADPPPTKPSPPTSLAHATDAEIFAYMGEGASTHADDEGWAATRTPPDLWSLEPKAAALALVDAYRTGKHRADCKLSIDEEKAAKLPEFVSIALNLESSRCMVTRWGDASYFLRVDPKDSYLLSARVWGPLWRLEERIAPLPPIDLRHVPLAYEDARHLARIIAALDTVEVREIEPGGTACKFSTADGSASLHTRDSAGHGTRLYGSWNGATLSSWHPNVDPEKRLGLVAVLFTSILPARLGDSWNSPAYRGNFFAELPRGIEIDAERARLAKLTEQFLSWSSVQEERISWPIVLRAVELAGLLDIKSAGDQIANVGKAFAAVPGPPRSESDVSEELDRTSLAPGLPAEGEAAEERDARLRDAEIKWNSLYQEFHFVRSVAGLREAMTRTLTQSSERLDARGSPDRLYELATSPAPPDDWALGQLRSVSPERYKSALAALVASAQPHEAWEYAEAVHAIDRQQGLAAVRKVARQKVDNEEIKKFSALYAADFLQNPTKRAKALLGIIRDASSGHLVATRAFEMLTPTAQATPETIRAAESAFFELLNPKSKYSDGAATKAAALLAQRGRLDAFDAIAKCATRLPAKSRPDHEFLAPLAHLVAQSNGKLASKFTVIAKHHLDHLSSDPETVLWAIWAADARDLLPQITALATTSPEGPERLPEYEAPPTPWQKSGPYHLARKIAILWTEPDPATRAKLLIAFRWENPSDFRSPHHAARVTRWQTTLRETATQLPAETKPPLQDLLHRLRKNAPQNAEYLPERTKLLSAAEDCLK